MTSSALEATIYYVRHGENRANISRQFSHRVIDFPLTTKGVSQAEEVAQRLKREAGIATPVFASPMRRAVETAQIIAAELETVVEEIEDFRELNVGSLDGKSDEKSWAIHEAVMDAWLHGADPARSFPGGENREQALARFQSGLRRVLESKSTGPVVVVGHGGLLLGTLSALCPTVVMPAVDFPNCGVAELFVRLKNGQVVGELLGWDKYACV